MNLNTFKDYCEYQVRTPGHPMTNLLLEFNSPGVISSEEKTSDTRQPLLRISLLGANIFGKI